MELFLHMVCICIAVLILQNEIQQHNNSNNGGEYQQQRVKQVIGSHHNNATMQQSNKSLLQMLGHPHMSYSSTLKNERSCREVFTKL